MNQTPVAAPVGPAPHVNPGEFGVVSFIQQGGAGKVFAGTWNTNNRKKVALKFFGYTKREPNRREIQEEIDLLQSLRGVTGIVQLEATFDDPPTGSVPGKQFRSSYPCIVMELLEGGELFDKIECAATVSERDLALIFRGLILALDSLHKRRYVHRDLKLENLMLANKKPHSPVKIIDLGMMVRMSPHKEFYRSSTIQGTVGYVAPESMLHRMYSPASDMWQAGVCLYSMLSGFSPFHPKHPEQITEHTYFPMKGVGWDNISDSAKDLISHILVKNVPDRFTAQQILSHPWVTTEAPRDDLGSEYMLRIKHLGIRQKMKTFFVENNIEEGNRLRRDNLRQVVPTLHAGKKKSTPSPAGASVPAPEAHHTGAMSDPGLPKPSGGNTDSSMPVDPSVAAAAVLGVSDFTGKLKELKKAVLRRSSANRLKRSGSSSSSDPGTSVSDGDLPATLPNPVPTVAVAANSGARPSSAGEIGYDAFLEIVRQCDLPELANPQVFSIFDIGNTGTINPKDFLLAMLAFRPDDDESASPTETGDEAARLYFNIFDINESGYIDLEELKVAAAFLLEEETLPMNFGGIDVTGTSAASSIEDLFSAIDVANDGRIDFEEFKVFYETVLVYSTTRRSITMTGGVAGPAHGDEDDAEFHGK